ncbi:structural protein [Stenotrophomonas phage vB_SmaS-AXL_1]|uniref:structural protein n=1 Tax=Stenotrophomonas phage vB_SmaS-AXL_1 TaxID=2909581 RepID=UPI00240A3B86|nr:structural protein [Stenotrophomonas phage vB_SmaS-AXL_1]UIS24776.1 structural protein [Stenotrophomonas phage vB_SmaS-AXL_1]
MARFQQQLRGFGIKTLDKVDKVRRASVLELFKLVIFSTPVDTGRLRGNWQTTINSPAGAAIDRLDMGGGAAMAEAVANLGSLTDVIWFTNNLPYAERIEYDGWSKQAPEGMVRRHLASWKRIVAAKARAF